MKKLVDCCLNLANFVSTKIKFSPLSINFSVQLKLVESQIQYIYLFKFILHMQHPPSSFSTHTLACTNTCTHSYTQTHVYMFCWGLCQTSTKRNNKHCSVILHMVFNDSALLHGEMLQPITHFLTFTCMHNC